MAINLSELTLARAHQRLVAGDISAVALAEAYLATIAAQDEEVHAYVEVYDDVLEQARAADARLKSGEHVTPLTGIPLAIKDNILLEGRTVTAASKILNGYVASFDATAITELKKAGAVFLGRTNMDEFAMGSSTEHSVYGPTKNPRDKSRVPGGSSGGSAAAVAMEGALAALGSDTGGSIRQPADFCGVVGLKPTYGAVSRSGLIAMGSSLDQIGPLTKTVEDAELMFNVLRTHDPLDSTLVSDACYPEHAGESRTKYTIGVPRNFLVEGIDPDVLDVFERSLETLKAAGCIIKDIDLPNVAYALPVYYIIMPAEVSTNLTRFDGVRFGAHIDTTGDLWEDYIATRTQGLGRETRRRIMLGTYVLSAGYYDAYYNKANAVRWMIRQDFARAFGQEGIPHTTGVDVIATPTSPSPAFALGERTSDPLQMYLADIFTVPANIAGIPAISIPSGTVTREGSILPTSLQLAAPWYQEARLFTLGKAFEAARGTI